MPPLNDSARSFAELLPTDKSGSHYFTARETDAAMLSTSWFAEAGAPQHEKFLFYRGAGSFATPLQVQMDNHSHVTLKNTEAATLKHLFVLYIRNGQGQLA